CRTMLEDGLAGEIDAGRADQDVEVLDVAQMLLASVKGEARKKKSAAAPKAPAAPAAAAAAPAEPAAGGSLFDTPAPAAEKPATGGSLFDTPAPEPAKPAATGGSLFD